MENVVGSFQALIRREGNKQVRKWKKRDQSGSIAKKRVQGLASYNVALSKCTAYVFTLLIIASHL